MDILPGDSTMYRILSECGAQIRTSLEGIDYFIAEGGRAFRTILEALEELLKFQVLNQQEKKDFSALFLQCKQYLRADFKVCLNECMFVFTTYNSELQKTDRIFK